MCLCGFSISFCGRPLYLSLSLGAFHLVVIRVVGFIYGVLFRVRCPRWHFWLGFL